MTERELFIAALRQPDGDARASFLEGACADKELLAELKSMLRDHDQLGSFLESPASPPTVTKDYDRVPEGPGTVIGHYELMEQIGEGGMGIVYVADQHQPVRRRVALKVIKPGMDTRQVVARFEAERQALAMMDHPNIAKVLDAGATPSGRPYFVMELVRGVPITEYCDEQQLTIRERLELFVLVCRAVQHAHQKGIIHRDLKPSNVLVTLHEGVPVPRIIDFGIAKATGESLTEKTVYTAFAQLIGTPLYMSPEQVEVSGLDVDTRSDVYSLGVLLYELLTGTTPFDSETLKRAAFDEMRRIIREEEPPKPSTRLSTLGATLSTVSARRQSDSRRLGRSVRGELDWIVMKSLEKDRRRRYETANDFAADVMRYLTDRPVEACPPSAVYRFAKFARRNRTALTVATAVAVSLVAGTAVSNWQAVVAARARRESDEAYATARRAVDEMYSQFAEEWIARQPRLTSVQRDFLEKALAFYEQFARQRADDPEAVFRAARAWGRVGSIERKLGRLDAAENALRQSYNQLAPLAARFPDRKPYVLELAMVGTELGALVVLRSGALGGTPPGVTQINRSVADIEAAVLRHPDDTTLQACLAYDLCVLGAIHRYRLRYAEAGPLLLRSRGIFSKLQHAGRLEPRFRHKMLDCENELGLIYRSSTSRLPEAESTFLGAVKLAESLLGEDPLHVNSVRRGLVVALVNVASVRRAMARQSDSIDYDRRANDLLGVLVSECPEDPENASVLESCVRNLFFDFLRLGRYSEADLVGRRGVTLCERLLHQLPEDVLLQGKLRALLGFLADIHSTNPADQLFDPLEALRLACRAVELDPSVGKSHRSPWPAAQRSLGWALYRTGDWRGCIDVLKRIYPDGDADYCAAMAYWRLGEKARAREVFARADRFLTIDENRLRKKEYVYPIPELRRRWREEAAALIGAASPR